MSTRQEPATGAARPPFRPLRLVLTVLLLVLALSFAAQWYAHQVTLPRYCADPAEALLHVERLLTERRPAGDGARRPYIIAARLTFLVPRRHAEPLEAYLARLADHLEQQCR